LTCSEPASASEYTATEPTPIRRRVRMMRQAMAPRLAIRTLENTRARSTGDDHADRRRIEAVAGVVDLRAVGDHRRQVHLGADLHEQAGGRDAVDDAERAIGLDR